MEIGASVWVRDPEQSWVSSTVVSKDEDSGTYRITVSDQTLGQRELICRLDQGDGTNDFDGIKLQNEPSEATVENLINLPYLHEPAILHCLQNRYVGGDIYTYTGPILIALNPFKAVPLYTPQILESYYNFGLLKGQGIEGGKPLPPHVYAVADAAYRDMMRVISHISNTKTPTAVNQTILISGESGAGKTESTKIVLRYLTTVGNSSGNTMPVTGSVMDKVLQSNPILESFGNAKTLRNDNSSRFGKFIELHFSKRGHLIGASIRTYLLEKVRLAAQQTGERNFHIMYQLIAGCTAEEKKAWQLGSAKDYWCCNQGDVFTLKSVDDAKEFADLRFALTTLNFDPADQQSLFGSIAGLMHLSQVSFVAKANVEEGCTLSQSADVTTHIKAVAELCGLSREQLERVLTVRLMTANNESYDIKLTPIQAVEARDALSKALYSRLFEWIVLRVNQSICVDDSSKIRAEIGVLDIFGFESFTTNSFEQLCINYTNETLQQQFNQFVFKLEQSEYQKEQISWSFIEFPDNQDCLDLIEHKQNGILAVLDDVCKLGQATDEKFANRLYKLLENNPRFTANKKQKIDFVFCVTHYAGPVEYLTTSFVEKNKNELPKEATSLFRNSSLSLLSSIFAEGWSPIAANDRHAAQPSTTGNSNSGAGTKVPSVSTQFKLQLGELMAKVSSTMPHYIRCLKPNDQNVPDKFHRRRTTEQLRYGGVLEAVRVARSGFPVRLSHIEFFARYRCVANPFNKHTLKLPASIDNGDSYDASRPDSMTPIKRPKTPLVDAPEIYCKNLLLAIWDLEVGGGESKMSVEVSQWMGLSSASAAKASPMSADSIQCGLTKVFLRKPAHDMLEGRRSRKIRAAVGRLQCCIRGYPVRRLYLTTLRAIGLIQRVVRGHAARRDAIRIRREKLRLNAATTLQTEWRASYHLRRYKKLLHAVVVMQSRSRGRAARVIAAHAAAVRRAVRLQRIVRGAVARIKWVKFRKAVVAIQCLSRCRKAKALLKAHKAAAKDVGKLQLNNDALKQEIEELRARAKDETRRMQAETEKRSAAAAVEELSDLRAELLSVKSELEAERASLRSVSSELMTSKAETQKAVKSSDELTALLEKRREEMKAEIKRMSKAGDEEVKKLKAEIKDLKDHASTVTTVETRRSRTPSAEIIALRPLHQEAHTSVTHSPGSGAGSGPASPAIRRNSNSNSSSNSSSNSNSNINIHSNDEAHVDRNVKANATAVATFERNLVTLRSKLRQGLKVVLWEEGHNSHVHNFECLLTLDKGYEALVFSPVAAKKATFTIFAQKIEVESIKIKDIDECCAGAATLMDLSLLSVLGLSGQTGISDENAADTLTIKIGAKVVDGESARVVSLKLTSRAERDFLHSAISTMISDMHVSRGKNLSPMSSPVQKAAPAVATVANGQSLNKLARDTAKAKEASDDAEKREKERERWSTETNSDFYGQLLAERSNFAKVMQQIFALTNDLNDKDDLIVKLKREVAALERTVFIKEKEHEQDSIVKVQLGKRLEQVLLDKEEAYEELEQLQVKLATLKAAMSNMDFKASAAVTISPLRK